MQGNNNKSDANTDTNLRDLIFSKRTICPLVFVHVRFNEHYYWRNV